MKGIKYLSKDKISKLPKSPGVYLFKNDKEFLYIGKTANIRERAKQHEELLNLVKQLGYIKTNSEIEALILEADLIKKYQPRYNVMWKDDKNYFYVGITKEDFSRILITHQPKSQNTKYKIQDTSYVGPFVDGIALKQTLKILRKVFPYRTCKTLPKHTCLWYQLSRCPAPCILKSNLAKEINLGIKLEKECQQNTKNLVKILQGRKIQVLKDLKREMKTASKNEDFEKAAKIRDQIISLGKVISHAKIFEFQPPQLMNWSQIQKILQKILKTNRAISRVEAYDVSNIQGKEATGSMITFINGESAKNFYRKFKIKIAGKPNDTAMIKEVLTRRFKHLEWPYPDLVLIDGGKAQLNAVKLTINSYQLTISVIALAKKKNELYIENCKNPVLLKTLPREIFNLILQLRDEAHRFAISYHRKLRSKTLID